MWATWMVAGIAFAGVAFMLRFLIALLRESAPSFCYWVVPLRKELEKKGHLGVQHGIYFDDDGSATESSRGDYRWERLENEHHAKEKCASGLVALDVRPVSDHLGWRSVHASRSYPLRERRL